MKKQDPTITGPTAWQGGGTNSGQSTMTTNASGLTLNAIDQLLVGFYKLPSEDLKALSTKLKNAGYPVRVTSKPTNDLKDQYIKNYSADVLVMGDDWKDKFNWVSCDVLYLERTPNISTTLIKNLLNEK